MIPDDKPLHSMRHPVHLDNGYIISSEEDFKIYDILKQSFYNKFDVKWNAEESFWEGDKLDIADVCLNICLTLLFTK